MNFEFMASSKDASGYDVVKEVINKGLCVGCGTCVTACPTRALDFNYTTGDLPLILCFAFTAVHALLRVRRALNPIHNRFTKGKLC